MVYLLRLWTVEDLRADHHWNRRGRHRRYRPPASLSVGLTNLLAAASAAAQGRQAANEP
jgi:hypothetical protein